MTMPVPQLPSTAETQCAPSPSYRNRSLTAICILRIQRSCSRAYYSARFALACIVLSMACFGVMAALGYAWSLFAFKAFARRILSGGMKLPLLGLCLLFPSVALWADELRISGLSTHGRLAVTGAFNNGMVCVEKASAPGGSWTPVATAFSTQSAAEIAVELKGSASLLRAVAADFTGNDGSWLFQAGDLLDLPTLAESLRTSPSQNPAVDYLRTFLSPNTLTLLLQEPIDLGPTFSDGLLQDLNGIIQGKLLYDADAFSQTSLSPSTQLLLEGHPTGDALQRLNRALLEDVFPVELRQKRAAGFSNFCNAYGNLSTVAGSGNITCAACNSWNDGFEGASAPDVALSSPHIAMADRAGNIYIADKRAHAIRKVLPDGTLMTVAGNGNAGRGDTNPAPAVSLPLNNPNGIWVREDGAFYILDRDNGLIRHVGTDGIMSVVVDHGSAIPGGRGLWVSEDETKLLYSAGTRLMGWDSTSGLYVYADGFVQLGNIALDPKGNVVVTDSDRNLVIRLESDGQRTIIAGNGRASGGGDGQLATETGLYLVRAICFLPSGAFLLGTDGGNQVWYVDTEGHIHLFLNGANNGSHAGDGSWFYDAPLTPKVSAVKQITMDCSGNLLITESTSGYIRKIPFLWHGRP